MFFYRQMLLLPSTKEDSGGTLLLTVDSDKNNTFRMSYTGSMFIDYGDGDTEELSATTATTVTHTY